MGPRLRMLTRPGLYRFLLLRFGCSGSNHSRISKRELHLLLDTGLHHRADRARGRLIHQYETDVACHTGLIDETSSPGAIDVDAVRACQVPLQWRRSCRRVEREIT